MDNLMCLSYYDINIYHSMSLSDQNILKDARYTNKLKFSKEIPSIKYHQLRSKLDSINQQLKPQSVDLAGCGFIEMEYLIFKEMHIKIKMTAHEKTKASTLLHTVLISSDSEEDLLLFLIKYI